MGELKWYQSSDTARRGFCADCGSPITFQRIGAEGEYNVVWLGTLDDPNQFRPTVNWHMENKIDWVNLGDGLHDVTPKDGQSRYDVF